jgi:hypothetical protein
MSRRCNTPGSHPDEFGDRLRHGGTPGQCGQYTTHSIGCTTIRNPRDTTLYGDGLDFLWVAGDGNAPTIWQGAANVANRLTLAGVPVAEVAPFQTAALADVAMERHSGASYRFNATARDPAAGQDAVVIVVGRMPLDTTGSGRFFSTYSVAAGQGIILYTASDNQLGAYVQTAGGFATSIPAAGHVFPGGLFTSALIYDRAADTVTLWTPGATGAAGAVVDGAIVGGGIGIGADPDSVLPLESGGGIIAAAYIIGAGYAADWAAGGYARCVELTRRLTGLESGYGAAPAFTRATGGSRLDRNGRLWIYSSGLARSGDSERLLVEPTRINRCYRNTGIPVGALAEQIGDDASTATGVDDSAALALLGLQDWGPNVCSYTNASGATRYIRCGAATGAVTRFALSVYGDIVAGAGPRIGWWDTAGPGWTDVGAASDGYARAVFPDLVPPAATCVCCLAVPDGCTYYWIAEQCEGSGSADECTVTSPIPNWATAATAQRNLDDLVHPLNPDDIGGSVELVAEPQGWGGAGNTVPVLFNTGAGVAVLYADRTTGTWTAEIDGTTALDSGVAPVDGTAHHIRLRWVQGLGMSIEVRLAATMALLGRADAAYDGTLSGAGTWEIAGGPVLVGGLLCKRNGGG